MQDHLRELVAPALRVSEHFRGDAAALAPILPPIRGEQRLSRRRRAEVDRPRRAPPRRWDGRDVHVQTRIVRPEDGSRALRRDAHLPIRVCGDRLLRPRMRHLEDVQQGRVLGVRSVMVAVIAVLRPPRRDGSRRERLLFPGDGTGAEADKEAIIRPRDVGELLLQAAPLSVERRLPLPPEKQLLSVCRAFRAATGAGAAAEGPIAAGMHAQVLAALQGLTANIARQFLAERALRRFGQVLGQEKRDGRVCEAGAVIGAPLDERPAVCSLQCQTLHCVADVAAGGDDLCELFIP